MKFKAYHKIKQFKDVIRDITYKANFKGLDENDEPIYEQSEKPVLTFKGSVKLHGTNAGVSYLPSEGILAQKRSSLLSLDNLASHFTFNQFVQVTAKEWLTDYMELMHLDLKCSDKEQITIYGEWAGTKVQQSVGISELPKAFYVFEDAKVYNTETEEERWVKVNPVENDFKIYFLSLFKTWEVEIDFNNPGLVQNQLIEITNSVEKDCPVSRELLGDSYEGELIGEGVVWVCFYQGDKYIFKVKGDKHSTSKVKKLASVNPEVLKSIQEFVEYSCTTNRIEQGIRETNATEKKDMPNLLRWMSNDIIAEESDALEANSLEWKQVARECSNKVRQYYFKKLETI